MSISNKELKTAPKHRQLVVKILPVLAFCCQWLALYFNYRDSISFLYDERSFLSFLGFGNPGGVSGNLSALAAILIAFSSYILLIVFSFIKNEKSLFAVPAALFVILYVPIIWGEKWWLGSRKIESLLGRIVNPGESGYGQSKFVGNLQALMDNRYCFEESFSLMWLLAGILIIVTFAFALSALLTRKRVAFLLSVIVGILSEVVMLTELFLTGTYNGVNLAVVGFQVIAITLFVGTYIVKAGYATAEGTIKAAGRSPSFLYVKFCPACGTRFTTEKSYCDKCGESLKEVIGDGSPRITLPLFCAKCGIGFEEGKKFCDRCGGELSAKQE